VSEIESQIWRAAIGHLREHAGCINATSSAITKALQASGFICEALASSRVQQRLSQPLLKKCHQKKSSESATTATPLTNAAHSARPLGRFAKVYIGATCAQTSNRTVERHFISSCTGFLHCSPFNCPNGTPPCPLMCAVSALASKLCW
jgi:hypothetical protein